jgi:hypothetical protein
MCRLPGVMCSTHVACVGKVTGGHLRLEALLRPFLPLPRPLG